MAIVTCCRPSSEAMDWTLYGPPPPDMMTWRLPGQTSSLGRMPPKEAGSASIMLVHVSSLRSCPVVRAARNLARSSTVEMTPESADPATASTRVKSRLFPSSSSTYP